VAAELPASDVAQLSDEMVAAMLPRRAPRSHKGSHGTLVCVCGSAEYAGAALLVAAAATRGGAGLVALAVPASLLPVVAGRVREAVTLALPESAPGEPDPEPAQAVIAGRRPNALVVGSGLRENEANRRLVLGIVQQQPPDPDGAARERLAPAVVDGGALNMLAGSGDWWRDVRRPCVLTPHPGEFARLTGEGVGVDDRERAARARTAAAQLGQVVVLKGAHTVVAAPDGRTAVGSLAVPALASAGTGDVLAGLIGALLAQGVAPFAAACAGVQLHARAGERLAHRLGATGTVASDLPLEIALVRHELEAG
jgi:ADP-dependent NAD(P)H-hydrate dehydratase / NAD(P)H-hydrate epimerase